MKKSCECCGIEFEAFINWVIYCSKQCSQKDLGWVE